MFAPHRTLARASPGARITGSPLADAKKPWNDLAQEIGRFERTMTGLGFSKPEAIRVAVIDRNILDYWDSSAKLNGDIWNLWSNTTEEVIVLKTFNASHETLKVDTGIFHEMMHAYLKRNYGPDTFIVKNAATEEALADFADVLVRREAGTERRGIVYDNGRAIRNIESRESYSDDSADEYLTSLFLSNALWNLKRQIGEEKISSLLKPFVDNLNIYRWSFERHYEDEPYLADEVGYFLAVLKKSARDADESKAVDRVIEQTAAGPDFNADRVEAIGGSLTDAQTLIEDIIVNEAQAKLGSMGRDAAIDEALKKVRDTFNLTNGEIDMILKGRHREVFGYDETFDHAITVRGHIEGTAAAALYAAVALLLIL